MIISGRPNTTRRAILEVSVDLIVRMACVDAAAIQIMDNALPADARVVMVTTGWDRPDVLHIVVESESFPEVDAGDNLPILPAPIFRVVEVP